MTLKLVFASVFFSIHCVFGTNILYIAPVASPSHHIWNRALALGLLEKSYNITMLGHDDEKKPISENFTIILLEDIYHNEGVTLDMDNLINQTPLTITNDMYEWAINVCERDLKTKGLQKLLNYPRNFFDLIIFDVSLGQCLYPLIEKFGDPPVVAVTPFLLPPVLSKSFGNHLYTSYMPFYNTNFSNKMNFVERIFNFVYVYYEQLYRKYIYMPESTKLAKNRFGENIRSLEGTERKINILLCNMDVVLDYPVALPPNIIPVGGLQAKPAKALPPDFKKILDNARDGVILFSLGTNVESDKLDLNKRQALLDAFSRISQTVLWKFGNENIENLPKNVIVRPWLPQNDILGHPNVKLFISHGGALSTQEAIYHGVPVLGIPFFCDQKANIAKMVQKDLATHVDIKNVTAEIMYEQLREMLNNPRYANNIRKVSRYYRDQPQSALERAVFWIEYTLKHKTVEHLEPFARDMFSFQINNVDVIGFFCVCLLVVYLFFRKIIKSCAYIFKHHQKQRKQKIN